MSTPLVVMTFKSGDRHLQILAVSTPLPDSICEYRCGRIRTPNYIIKIDLLHGLVQRYLNLSAQNNV